MSRLLSKNNRLVSNAGRLLRDDATCKAACCGGGGGPCCEWTGPSTATRHSCGRTDALHSFCVGVFAYQIIQRTTFRSSGSLSVNGQLTPAGIAWLRSYLAGTVGIPPDQSDVCTNLQTGATNYTVNWSVERITHTETDGSLRGPNYWAVPPGGCGAIGRVPVREIVKITTTDGPYFRQSSCPAIPSTSSEARTTGTLDIVDWCVQVDGLCWPLSAEGPHDGVTPPGYSAFARSALPGPPLGAQGPTTTITTRSSLAGTVTVRTTTQSNGSLTWQGGDSEWYESSDGTSREEVVETTNVAPQTVSNEYGTYTRSSQTTTTTINEQVIRREARVRAGWTLNCDGSPGPNGCVPVETDCAPGIIRYIIGVPCGGGVVPVFVLPELAVETCGYVEHGGVCYKFDPNGQRTTNPAAMGATVGNQIVNADSFRSCCECSALCPKTTLVSRPEWLNGTRNALSGAWSTSPAFVTGNCCCKPGDRFRVASGTSKLIQYFNGQVFNTEQFDIIVPPNPLTGIPDVVTGFRRDAGPLHFGLRFRLFDFDGSVIQDNSVQIVDGFSGPVGCEWNGLGVQLSFSRPLHATGMHPWGQNVPYPYEVQATGIGPTWRIERYTVSVTCSGLTAEGEWVQLDSSQNIQYRLTASQVWVVTPDTSNIGPCDGGCAQQGGLPPVLGTTPGGPGTLTPQTLTDLLGGI